ncbi:MAG: ferritin-like domain-containing protein [Myxococcales bacterium]|nr:ferritin-like domain-containing protein [Myxococcales bacterium]
MKSPNETGMNRTGIKTSPFDSRATEAGAEQGEPTSFGGESLMAAVRLELAQEGEPVGSMPPPASLKGVAKSAMTVLKGESPTLLLNKLGERLAFERTGVRLYEAVIDKLPAFTGDGGSAGPTVADLRAIQEDELRHVDVVRRAIETLGGDPTAMTPAADIGGVSMMGVMQVVCDPRAQLADSLHALLTAELVDNDGWELLIQLARGLGQEQIAQSFAHARDQEHLHLVRVRSWVMALAMREAGIAHEATVPAGT